MSGVKRQYRQSTRAEQTAATRRRIVEAAVRLHTTVGPARTSLSAVAREAGVSRPTLYAHFTDEGSLFRACTMHSMAQDPPPDPASWSTIADPRERTAAGLTEMYAYFSRNEQMLENVLRDMYVVESMREFNVELIERSFEQMTQILAAAFDDPPEVARRRSAVVSIALQFETWKTLVGRQGLRQEEAVALMTDVIGCSTT